MYIEKYYFIINYQYVNSKFESKPAVKKIEELKEFKKNVITNVVK